MFTLVKNEMNILIKIPSKNRGLDFLEHYISKLENPKNVHFLLSFDFDDKNIESIKTFQSNNTSKNIEIVIGESKGKIDACNRDVNEYIKSLSEKGVSIDIIVLGSDDMQPQSQGYDSMVTSNFRNLKSLDNALWFWDGAKPTQKRLCTYPIMGIDYYNRFNYIYAPCYESLFADNEYTEVGLKLKKIHYIDFVMFKHLHPAWSTRQKDDLDSHNDMFWDKDKSTYQLRKKQGFPKIEISERDILSFSGSTKKWCILIPTLKGREKLLNRVGTNIRSQIDGNGLSGIVDIITNCDNKQKTIGKKRNELIDEAIQKGFDYISFVDDDDNVSERYVTEIYERIQSGFDCICINGLYTSKTERTEWVMKPKIKNENKEGKYYRMANHLACWKLDIVKERFKEISLGEDSQWSERMQKHIANPTEIQEIMYYYEFNPNISVQQKKNRKN
jgi:hypothetical protein